MIVAGDGGHSVFSAGSSSSGEGVASPPSGQDCERARHGPVKRWGRGAVKRTS